MTHPLTEVMTDQQTLIQTQFVERRFFWQKVAGKAFVCIGARRSGKTTFLFQIIHELRQSGIDPRQTLYLNFFDDRFQPLRHEGFSQLMDVVWELDPFLHGKKLYLFLDELQEILEWEPFVERLLREGHHVFITGSSAKLLSKEIATQMRGRALSWEMFPFAWDEFLKLKNVKKSDLGSQGQAKLRLALKAYMQEGGFPEVINKTPSLRTKIHQEYFHTMLYRDVIERHDVRHPRAVQDLGYRLLSQFATLYTVNRLTASLRSLGHKVDKNFVSSCLEWFEDCYFFFSVRIFDHSLQKQLVNPKKIYCIDHAMPASIVNVEQNQLGQVVENMVFIYLRRLGYQISYYRTASGKEVDFIIQKHGQRLQAIQVCFDMTAVATAEREISALQDCLQEQKLKMGFIIVGQMPKRPTIKLSKNIRILSLQDVLLNEQIFND